MGYRNVLVGYRWHPSWVRESATVALRPRTDLLRMAT